MPPVQEGGALMDDRTQDLASAVIVLSGLLLIILWAWWTYGCSSTPTMPPPPLQIGSYDVQYRRGYLDGPALAGASWEHERTAPIIYMDEELEYRSPAVQWFVWAHEVCHLEGETTELGADCCAARRLDRIGVPLSEPLEHLQTNSHTSRDHPPGSVRALTFISCYIGAD